MTNSAQIVKSTPTNAAAIAPLRRMNNGMMRKGSQRIAAIVKGTSTAPEKRS